ncbi:FUSC family protein [Desulfovibrio sp. OttesenSCG-928-G15]|nr:FUSC family protein [Desulfovibrio sp. OttesenSCG-928-G15]
MKLALDSFFPLYVRYGLKVGIACLLSYGLSYAIGLDYPAWAVAASIIAVQINVADSMHAGIVRITGTAIGAAIGALLLLFLPQSQIILAGAVFGVTIVCGYFVRFSNIGAVTAVAAVVVLFSGAEHLAQGSTDAISFGLLRVAEIAIGVGSAFFVSIVLWPVRLADTLHTDLSLQFLECARLVDVLVNAFLSGESLPFSTLNGIEGKIWDNHERLKKAGKHESALFRYEHKVMDVQVKSIDRTTESLHSMMEALNDYDEENVDTKIGTELRALADAIMAALRHLGSDNPTASAPDLVRGLTLGVGLVEEKLNQVRQDGSATQFSLHKALEIYSFYQAMRLLAESLLIAMERMNKQGSSKGFLQP